jgi:hypothetical protein
VHSAAPSEHCGFLLFACRHNHHGDASGWVTALLTAAACSGDKISVAVIFVISRYGLPGKVLGPGSITGATREAVDVRIGDHSAS